VEPDAVHARSDPPIRDAILNELTSLVFGSSDQERRAIHNSTPKCSVEGTLGEDGSQARPMHAARLKQVGNVGSDCFGGGDRPDRISIAEDVDDVRVVDCRSKHSERSRHRGPVHGRQDREALSVPYAGSDEPNLDSLISQSITEPERLFHGSAELARK
jgi:hypothetical protein